MGFFESINADSLTEDHAQDVLKLESEEAARLLEVYERVAVKLRASLMREVENDREDRFTAQKMRIVLIQLESAIQALQTNWLERLFDITDKVAMDGIEDLASEIRHYDEIFLGAPQPISLNLSLVASDTSKYLFNQFETSMNTYTQDVRERLAIGLNDAVIERLPTQTIIDGLFENFKGESWRLRRIVRTELHSIYGQSKIEGMKTLSQEEIPDLKKTLYHPLDARTSEDSKHLIKIKKQMIVEPEEDFKYEWPVGSGKWRIFQAVDRPNDRAIVIPYRDTWALPTSRMRNRQSN